MQDERHLQDEPLPEDEPKAVSEEITGLESELENLRQALETVKAQADEHWQRVLRMQAEQENQRKRAERDVANAHKYGLEKMIAELLPVKDSLEMGLAAAAGDVQAEKIREGVELTLKMFADVLQKFGVEEVNPLGQPFNPEHHQAMTMQESQEYGSNTVMLVMQKGYLLNERLVRPAMVIVSK